MSGRKAHHTFVGWTAGFGGVYRHRQPLYCLRHGVRPHLRWRESGLNSSADVPQ